MKSAWYHPNIDKIYAAPLHGGAVELTYPYSLCLQTSNFCNLRCHYCISNSSPEGAKVGNWIPSALSKVSNLFGPTRIVWSGGEPSLISDITDMIQLSYLAGNANIFTTNATRFIAHSAISWVDISIYGNGDESYKKNTGRPIPSNLWKNIERYVSYYSGKVSVSILIGICSIEETLAICQKAVASGVRKIRFQRPMSTISYDAPSDLSVDETIAELKRRIPNNVFISFPNSTSSENKRSGYFFIKNGLLISNGIETFEINDIGVGVFLEKNRQHHEQMFITPLENIRIP